MTYAFDLETFPISPGMLVPRAVVLSAYNGKDKPILIKFPEAIGFLDRHLGKTELVAHNGAYDLAVIAAEEPFFLPRIFDALERGLLQDTMVAGKLINIARGEAKYQRRDDNVRIKSLYSLEAMAKLYLGRELKKEGTYRTRYHELVGLPIGRWPTEAVEYAETDAVTTYDVHQAQLEYVRTDPMFRGEPLPDLARQLKAAWVLHLMSVWGVRTDGKAVAELKAKLEMQLAGAHDFLLGAGLIHQPSKRKKNAL